MVNCKQLIRDFSAYPENWPDLYTDARIYYGNYKDLTGQLEFNYEIDSIKTVVIGFPENFIPKIDNEIKIRIFGFIVHEVFHQFQRDHFGEIPWSREEKYPILDAGNTASAFLEMKLLSKAIKAMDNNNTNNCKELLLSFSQVRKDRWENADDFVRIYEQGQEINEGTAKYVEVKSILEMNKRAKAEKPDIHLSYLDAFKSTDVNYLLNEFNNNLEDGTITPENMIRNRIYPVGAAQGILMDYLEINWKSKAQEAGDRYTFNESILEKFGNNIDSSGDKIKMEYNYPIILKSTNKKIEEYHQHFSKEIASFNNQKGMRIEISFEYSSLSRSGSSIAKKWVMNSGKKSLCMNYRLLKLKTKQIKIDLENLAVLQLNDWDNKKMKVVVYSSELDPIELDSVIYKLSDIKKSQFTELDLSGKGIKIHSDSNGQIEVVDNRLLITY